MNVAVTLVGTLGNLSLENYQSWKPDQYSVVGGRSNLPSPVTPVAASVSARRLPVLASASVSRSCDIHSAGAEHVTGSGENPECLLKRDSPNSQVLGRRAGQGAPRHLGQGQPFLVGFRPWIFFLGGGACAEPSTVICRIMINIRTDGFNEPPLYLLRFGGLGSLSHAPREIRRIRSFS